MTSWSPTTGKREELGMTLEGAIPLAISLLALVVAILGYAQQRRIPQHVATFAQIASAEASLAAHPDLLALHNIDRAALSRYGVSEHELVYLIQSFTAAELF